MWRSWVARRVGGVLKFCNFLLKNLRVWLRMSSLKPNAQIMCILSASCIYMRHIHIHLWVWYISVCTNSILRNEDQQPSFRECIALGLGLPLLTLKGKVIKDRSWLTDRMMTCLSVGDPSQLCQPFVLPKQVHVFDKVQHMFCLTSGWLKMFLFYKYV